MRNIHLVSVDPSSIRRIWSSPWPPNFQPWNFYHSRDSKSRLDYTEFNAPVKGLFVCCANGNILGIHGFSKVSKSFWDFVDLVNQRAKKAYKSWIYFPFNEGEYVVAVWVRKLDICRGSAANPVLIVSLPIPYLLSFAHK